MAAKTSGFAIASLVLGILHLLLYITCIFLPFVFDFIFNILGPFCILISFLISTLTIILGIAAVIKIRHDKNLTGTAFAIIGVVLGFISLILYLLIIFAIAMAIH